MKNKKCKVPYCRAIFEPRTPLQSVCSPKCAGIWAGILREKKELLQKKEARKEYREAKLKMKRRGEWKSDAQDIINLWIKLRDYFEPCISCGKHRNAYDAGHYLARSIRPELAFHEDNIHKQCVYCNNYNKGVGSAGYRPNLIKKIGIEKVEELEKPHPPAHHTIEFYQGIISTYKQKIKERKKELNLC